MDENIQHFNDLLDHLQDLSLSSSVKVLVPSRDGTSAALYQRAVQIRPRFLHIRPENREVRSYVISRLSHILEKQESGFRAGFVRMLNEEDEREHISSKIVAAADGNFLCAQLQITMLRNLAAETLRKRLNTLPSTLASLFSDTMARVLDADRINGHELGQRALLWALYAKCQLTVAALSHALATYPAKAKRLTKLNEDHIPTTQEIIDSKCYFLSVDGVSGAIQVHAAVKDYYLNFFNRSEMLDIGVYIRFDPLHFPILVAIRCLHFIVSK